MATHMSDSDTSSTQRSLPTSRSSISAALWGHLLQKRPSIAQLTPDPNTAKSYAPIAPLDKAGTSMRILLHDTQANLEKFSERVDKLTSGVDDAKMEISAVHRLFERQQEQVIAEVVKLVNRCQSEVQKYVGTPAQAAQIEEICKILSLADRKVDALDKKIDLLHMLNQTQTQALQTLQDQQGKLIEALTPILPLLQAIPLHIDSARNDLKDTVRQMPHICSHTMQMLPSRTAESEIESSGTLNAISRSSSGVLAISSPPHVLPRKRSRTKIEDALAKRRKIAGSQSHSIGLSQGLSTRELHSSRLNLFAASHHTLSACEDDTEPASRRLPPNVLTPDALVLPTASDAMSIRMPVGQTGMTVAPAPSAESRPLASLLQVWSPGPSQSVDLDPTAVDSFVRSRLEQAKPACKPLQAPTSACRPSLHPSFVINLDASSPWQAGPLDRISMPVSVSPQPSVSSGFQDANRDVDCIVPHPDNEQLQQRTGDRPKLRDSTMPGSLPLHPISPTKPPPGKPMSLKDRRTNGLLAEPALLREGKRFIPLDDDEEENVSDG